MTDIKTLAGQCRDASQVLARLSSDARRGLLASMADALDADLLTGALLDAVANNDAATREGWRKAGAAFFRGKQRKPAPRPDRQPESTLPLEGGAASH